MKRMKQIILVTLAVGALASVEASAFSLTNAKDRVVKFVERNKKPIMIGGAIAATALVIAGIVGSVMIYNSRKGAASAQTGTGIGDVVVGLVQDKAASLVASTAAASAQTLPVTTAAMDVVKQYEAPRSIVESVESFVTGAVDATLDHPLLCSE